MQFYPDEFEPDDAKEQATAIVFNETPGHHTIYPKLNTDWFAVQGIAGAEFRISAADRQPATHALITVFESDGVVPLADNINPSDPSQLFDSVQFATPQTATYYVTFSQYSYSGIYSDYGTYDADLRIAQAPDDSAEIHVTPTGLVVNLPVGETEDKTFTINNIGGGPLHSQLWDQERYGDNPPPASWVSQSPDSVVVEAGGSQVITATFDATGLHPDTTYDAIIFVDSNDLVEPEVQIIVRLTTTPVGIDGDDPASILPKVFALNQNFPNPFNPSTSIVYDIPESVGEDVPVTLVVYNMRGQKVHTLIDEAKQPGRYSVHWDGKNGSGEQVSSGIYLYKITAGDYVKVKKMVLLK
jgi:hypothetical protein